MSQGPVQFVFLSSLPHNVSIEEGLLCWLDDTANRWVDSWLCDIVVWLHRMVVRHSNSLHVITLGTKTLIAITLVPLLIFLIDFY